MKIMEWNRTMPNTKFTTHFTESSFGIDILSEKELATTLGYSAKRLQQFCTGRYCAKQALLALQATEFEILKGPEKEPLWQEGYTGSISHTEGLAGAIVANKTDYLSLGLDIEITGKVTPDLWEAVFTVAEICYLQTLNPEEQLFYATLFFSMKECFYKLQYPLTGVKLWFHDATIVKEEERYVLEMTRDLSDLPFLPERIEIYYCLHKSYIITVAML